MRLIRAPLVPIVFSLVALALAVYRPVGDHSFLYDDFHYVTRNPVVLKGLTGEGMLWSLRTFTQCNWHPLTWFSHMLDVQFFGADPRAHHLVNAALHAANSVLLLLVLRGLTGALWGSAVVAALFTVHPLNVESVAWVAERKNLLSTFFLFLTLGAYTAYVRRRKITPYVAAAVGFALGLMSKPMLVTLPFLLLLLDWWPLGRRRGAALRGEPGASWRRWSALAGEKAPFFVLALASSVITYHAQRAGDAVRGLALYGFWFRVANALQSYVDYLLMAAWPAGLAVFYPFAGDEPQVVRALLCGLALAGVSALAVVSARRRPYLPVGWLWYLGTLVPVIGLVQVGDQARADRYAYVPLIGVFIALAWGGRELVRNRPRLRMPALGAAILFVVALGLLARRQVAVWKEMATLFEHALQVTANNPMSHYHLAVAYSERGDNDRAMRHFQEALRLFPEDDQAHINIGVVLLKVGRIDEGLWHFQEAARWNPGSWNVYYNLGVAYHRKGDWARAEAAYRRSLQLNPEVPNTLNNLGIVLMQIGRIDEAAGIFRAALAIQADFAEARLNLQRILARRGPGAPAPGARTPEE